LKLLLEGTDVKKYALENHLMLSIVISKINEAFYDEIGDVIIEFDGDNPILIEDYIGDVKEIIGE
ncbi:tellurite resistance TerB C-terminal domain-containing protein, partial [Butyrivibrio sp. NC3005]